MLMNCTCAVFARHPHWKRFDDAHCDVILKSQEVARREPIHVRPGEAAIRNPHQSRCNVNRRAALLDGAGQHVIHAETATNGVGIVALRVVEHSSDT
jgi:hypothetical protein